MNKMDEQIVVAPRKNIFQEETLTFQGVTSNQAQIEPIMAALSTYFDEMRRGDAEENEAYKQPIPYVVIRRGSQVYLYERLQKGGEARLHNKLSIGFGGHMNTGSANTFPDLITENMMRELQEELYIERDMMENVDTIGLINDDDTDVGRVHIGILTVIDVVKDAIISIKETDQLSGRWISITALNEDATFNRLERWSQYVARILQRS
ncbi:hypothetical protein NSQ26_13415 [Bacillus sp. FSL W7-1360]